MTDGEHLGLVIFADGVPEVLAASRMQFRNGAHFLKVFIGGAVSGMYDPLDIVEYSLEELKAAGLLDSDVPPELSVLEGGLSEEADEDDDFDVFGHLLDVHPEVDEVAARFVRVGVEITGAAFHEPGAGLALATNKDRWDSLSKSHQRIIEIAEAAEKLCFNGNRKLLI